MTSSTAFSVASSSFTPAAFTLSVTCSGRLAPMMAAETLSFWSTHATASWARVRPASSAIGRSCWTRSRTSSCIQRLIMSAPPLSSVARDPSGGA
jgi:hypothetical protein